ncbi:exported hypothetical protein [Mesorhizobium plurifarium]|uniref:Uncharacterized protein n=1 Tax=Mesorhizobium plurifarium TaxID=69974 RepID=A0A090E3W8_MESPL|nr:exported hypothetical protein [Mesorhizobium plurifarium]
MRLKIGTATTPAASSATTCTRSLLDASAAMPVIPLLDPLLACPGSGRQGRGDWLEEQGHPAGYEAIGFAANACCNPVTQVDMARSLRAATIRGYGTLGSGLWASASGGSRDGRLPFLRR